MRRRGLMQTRSLGFSESVVKEGRRTLHIAKMSGRLRKASASGRSTAAQSSVTEIFWSPTYERHWEIGRV